MLSCGVCVCLCVWVSGCVCVCVSVTFVHCVKMNKDIFEIFSQSGSHTILVFQHQMGWRYSDGNPPNGTSNAGGVGRNRDSEPICKSLFTILMPAVDAATGEVSSTWSAVEHSHHLASCDTYIAGRILRVFDHQAPRVIKSQFLCFYSARATKRALALYTITIDRVYDSKA